MSKLAKAIADVMARNHATITWPTRTMTAIAASKIKEGHSAPPQDPSDLNDDAARLLKDLQARRTLSVRDLGRAPWCLWATTPALADFEHHLHELLRQIASSKSRRPLRNLAIAYMSRPKRAENGGYVGMTLAKESDRMGRPWSNLHQTFSIFDPNEGPPRVAKRAIEDDLTIEETLTNEGMRSGDVRTTFGSQCLRAALEILEADASGRHLERLRKVAKLALDDEGNLKSKSRADGVARALIRPFSGTIPDDATLPEFQDLLLRLFKDPRLSSSSWQRMPEEADAFRRWLTSQNLKQFLEVTRIVAKDMFKYRDKFWRAVYDANLIDESWVVFAEDGRREAISAFGTALSFATFEKGGRKTRDQAVLLLRMGDRMVVEWSHDGKVYIFDDHEDERCPKLYRRTYFDGDLRLDYGFGEETRTKKSVFARNHSAPDHYTWQDAVAERIEYLTGVKIPRSAYRI